MTRRKGNGEAVGRKACFRCGSTTDVQTIAMRGRHLSLCQGCRGKVREA